MSGGYDCRPPRGPKDAMPWAAARVATRFWGPPVNRISMWNDTLPGGDVRDKSERTKTR